MNLTEAETILLNRCGIAMMAAGRDGTTTPNNPDLVDPMGKALRALGYQPASLTAIANADLGQIQTAEIDAFLDLSEVNTLENAMSAASGLVDISIGPRRESLSQLAGSLEKLIQAKQSRIKDLYPWLASSGLTGGVISLDFAEHDAGTPGRIFPFLSDF